eukprot:scaffold465497_cov28-Prasinocladus_malaysianus.AAC.1
MSNNIHADIVCREFSDAGNGANSRADVYRNNKFEWSHTAIERSHAHAVESNGVGDREGQMAHSR